ncbi:MAG TPA: glycosyltransferase family 39 protein, partial [Opitutaceae bacterium]|nr:glycosyltransferase family 39 protein [Opitutaceae bacterium]
MARPAAPFGRLPRGQLLAGLGLVALVLLAYAPALGGGFIWDDDGYVTKPALQSWHGLWRIWFDLRATEQYYPLLHTLFWAEHWIWGDSAPAYHWASVLLHALAACLLARVLVRLLGSAYAAWFAALVFALHPVCVESVAWIAEQKNTLSLVFYLASALAYLRFEEGRRRRDYALAAALFVLAVLSKTVTATLPAALLVALWWKRGRLELRRDALPLLPWLAFGAAAGAFSGWVERTYIGAKGGVFDLGLAQRLILAGRTGWFYLGKLLWPARLIFIYPRWAIDARDPAQWLPLLAMAALVLGLAAWVRARPGWAPARSALAALLFFLGSLVPTSGLFNVYGFLFSYVADHWQYLPALGVIVLVAGGVGRAAARGPAWARWAAP